MGPPIASPDRYLLLSGFWLGQERVAAAQATVLQEAKCISVEYVRAGSRDDVDRAARSEHRPRKYIALRTQTQPPLAQNSACRGQGLPRILLLSSFPWVAETRFGE